ncbi:MAG: cupin-like domain-containing protein [Pseudomonadota bacterium]
MHGQSIFDLNLPALERVENVTRAQFDEEVRPAGRPVIMKNVVQHWPAVQAAQASQQQLAAHLRDLDVGANVPAFVAPPEVEGRYFYTPDMRRFTFETRQIPFRAIVDKLLELSSQARPIGVYAGASPTVNTLPQFANINPMPLVDAETIPKVWLSNSARIAPHFDISENIACLVSGERRFVIFPPEQIANLYVGPIDYNMAGQPASMVDLTNIDLTQFPKFETAAATAQIAELDPGDAVYLPSLWWHFVESKGPFNVLVNYWFDHLKHGTPMNVLALALLVLRDLPENDRTAWKSVFEHYVFDEDAAHAVDHIPDAFRGVLGQGSPDRDAKLKTYLQAHLPNILK